MLYRLYDIPLVYFASHKDVKEAFDDECSELERGETKHKTVLEGRVVGWSTTFQVRQTDRQTDKQVTKVNQ